MNKSLFEEFIHNDKQYFINLSSNCLIFQFLRFKEEKVKNNYLIFLLLFLVKTRRILHFY